MTFLQPLLLLGLPLIALPVLIHLINRQRHRTKKWAAMMFLLNAKKMAKGMARLRQILIMAMRILAVGALIFAVSRPLASGWLGLTAGGRPSTVVIVLDRSVSMEQRDLPAPMSKRETALDKLVDLVDTLGATTRVVLVESTQGKAREIQSAASLRDLPDTSATAAGADLPTMLQEAADYVAANQTGRTDVWIASDLRAADWAPQSGRWQAVQQAFIPLRGVRFQLLTYGSPARNNVAVRVDNVKRRVIGNRAELVFDVTLRRDMTEDSPRAVDLSFVINGARSVQKLELNDAEYALQGHVIPIDAEQETGWGRVELPADSNLQDNVFYFVYGPQPEHRTVVVSDDPQTAEPLRLAAATPADPGVSYVAEVVAPNRLDGIDWENTGLILWQAPLPKGATAAQLQQFVDNGRSLVFFPPENPDDTELFGARWGDWTAAQQGAAVPVSTWRGDSGLLSKTQSGAALPVGDLKTFRYCGLETQGSVLARFEGGDPLLAQAGTDTGGVYFCSTLPRTSHSSLARDGVVFYVMLQRALSAGASTLGKFQHRLAGPTSEDTAMWQPQDEDQAQVLSSEREFHAGVYAVEDQLLAINRPPEEDAEAVVGEAKLPELFAGLDYRVVKDQVGSASSLAAEIWKTFLVMMAIALIAEAALCIPARPVHRPELGLPTPQAPVA